jgi:hypothetical protein
MTAMVSSAASEKTAVGEQHCPDYFPNHGISPPAFAALPKYAAPDCRHFV